jgi:hypothetical protein
MFKIQRQRGGQRILRINTIYKRKADKVKPINSDKSDNNISGRSKSWRENII